MCSYPFFITVANIIDTAIRINKLSYRVLVKLTTLVIFAIFSSTSIASTPTKIYADANFPNDFKYSSVASACEGAIEFDIATNGANWAGAYCTSSNETTRQYTFYVPNYWDLNNGQTFSYLAVSKLICPIPDTYDVANGICIYVPTLDPKGAPGNSCPASGQPISFGYGNKYLFENDYVATTLSPLTLTRIYSSTSAMTNDHQGFQWRASQSRRIVLVNNQVNVYRADGKVYTFNLVNNLWKSDVDITDQLTQQTDTNGLTTGWTYKVDSTSQIESYDANGNLIALTDKAGLSQHMSYSCKTLNSSCSVVTPDNVALVGGLLIQVGDPFGKILSFNYDSRNRVKTMIDPSGGVFTYGYSNAANSLTSVTYPDGKSKTYLYENATFLNALTGIIDENGTRYVTYNYDSSGRAYDEYLAPNAGITPSVEHNNLVYNVDSNGNPTSTVVTDALGSARTYNFTTVLGVVKSTGQSQPAGSGCSAAASNLTYDANGNVASRTDFNGNMTTYGYDLTRNLETSRTEGLTSSGASTTATRTITTTWHATWRLPLVITEYTGPTATGTALKKTTYTYDTKGNITSFKEEDPVRTLSRTTTTTYTYSTVATGLVVQKVIDGPRTDISDITTYNYFDANASCAASASASTATNLGCRGQLQTITNALGQVTTFNRYNHHGQVEQMTDPNGTVTTNTYDLRQRLLTRTISGTGITAQTTTLTYDNAGQITQLKMPDNSTLNYTYDDAHRLTQVQDTLGNKVVYTLDAAGNHTAEKTYDPSGSLAKTLTRSYDALNRLQTLTGKE